MPLKVVPTRDRKLHRLVKRGDNRTLKRGEVLYQFGEPGGVVYLVRTGHLRLTLPGNGGKERTIALAGPWELAGEEGLVAGFHRKTGAQAGQVSQVTTLEGEGVKRALGTAAKTLDAFLLARAEEQALAVVLSGSRRPGGAPRRLGALLLHLSARMGRSEEAGVRIPISLTHQVLADLSGSHRSTVTTLLNDWIYEGVLRDEGSGLRILDPSHLEALARG